MNVISRCRQTIIVLWLLLWLKVAGVGASRLWILKCVARKRIYTSIIYKPIISIILYLNSVATAVSFEPHFCVFTPFKRSIFNNARFLNHYWVYFNKFVTVWQLYLENWVEYNQVRIFKQWHSRLQIEAFRYINMTSQHTLCSCS